MDENKIPFFWTTMVSDQDRVLDASKYLNMLCKFQPHRRTGSAGNRAATAFLIDTLRPWGYSIEASPFPCLDFFNSGSSLWADGRSFEVLTGPYSPGCEVSAELEIVCTVTDLESSDCTGKLLLLHGEICAEQLMPKNFPFYNPDEHKRIYTLLERKRPLAVVTATGKNPETAGAAYPFPLIEDGDFDIPSVYCTDIVGDQIAAAGRERFTLDIAARRVPATACNVIAAKSSGAAEKVVVSAHVDAKEGTPGALDNASGIVILLLLAEMLAEYDGHLGIEFVAFNGEDHYSAGGEIDYLRRYGDELERISLAVNIDAAGYVRGKTAYSLYGCPEEIEQKARTALTDQGEMIEGDPWYQGDHMVFAQKGVPALAVTSERAVELFRDITHTAKDNPELVDCAKLVAISRALKGLVGTFCQPSREPDIGPGHQARQS